MAPEGTAAAGPARCADLSPTIGLPPASPGATLVEVNRRLWVLALVVAVVPAVLPGCTAEQAAVACVIGTHHPSGQEGTCVTNATPAVRARLLATARQTARDNHGVAQRVVAVESADADVNAFLNLHGFSKGVQVEWVLQASGHFTCGSDCFGTGSTSGQRPKTVLTMVIDSTAFGLNGFEISNDWVNLSKIGTVVLLQT
jgi:hypothetical protein